MSLCYCDSRPRCEWNWCDAFADWSVFQPHHRRFRFMCAWHEEQHRKALTERVPGLDSPLGASDFWRPSLFDVVQLADLEIRRQAQTRSNAIPIQLGDSDRIRAMTPAQRETLLHLRRVTIIGPEE